MFEYKKTILDKAAYNPYDMKSFDREEKEKGKLFDEAKITQRAADQVVLERVEDEKQQIITALIEHIERLEKQVKDLGAEPVK